MADFSAVVRGLKPLFDEKEKRQDKALMLSREAVRLAARAIRDIHTGEKVELSATLEELEKLVLQIREYEADFSHITDHCFQEYAEIKALLAVTYRQDLPSPEDLSVQPVPYLNGIADAAGEMRRALQVALKDGKEDEANYLFSRMNEVYDNIMLLKYSASIVGPLKQKQDMVRSSIDHARSELLMAKFAKR
jgi:translin